MKQFLSRFWSHQRGVAFIEFATVFPFMFLLLFGGIEVARYILITQKVEKAAYVITDIVGQYPPAADPAVASQITVDELQNNVFPQFHRMMGTFGVVDREGVIMSSVINTPNNGLQMRWQQPYLKNGAQVANAPSIVTGQPGVPTAGTACKATNFPPNVNALLANMTKGENMIVGEVFYFYRPLVAALFPVSAATPTFNGGGGFTIRPQIIARRLYLHPRNGELVDLPPVHPVVKNTKPCQ